MRNYNKLGVQDTATELLGCELGPRQAVEGGSVIGSLLQGWWAWVHPLPWALLCM